MARQSNAAKARTLIAQLRKTIGEQSQAIAQLKDANKDALGLIEDYGAAFDRAEATLRTSRVALVPLHSDQPEDLGFKATRLNLTPTAVVLAVVVDDDLADEQLDAYKLVFETWALNNGVNMLPVFLKGRGADAVLGAYSVVQDDQPADAQGDEQADADDSLTLSEEAKAALEADEDDPARWALGGGSDGFWYDLVDGGYFKPDKVLTPESAARVHEAVATLRQLRSIYSELTPEM